MWAKNFVFQSKCALKNVDLPNCGFTSCDKNHSLNRADLIQIATEPTGRHAELAEASRSHPWVNTSAARARCFGKLSMTACLMVIISI
jgi:hypothetical protein